MGVQEVDSLPFDSWCDDQVVEFQLDVGGAQCSEVFDLWIRLSLKTDNYCAKCR